MNQIEIVLASSYGYGVTRFFDRLQEEFCPERGEVMVQRVVP